MARVFVSYSHDSDVHRDRVLALVRRLRADGQQVGIDQDIGPSGPANGWELWSQHAVEDADRVLAVCTAPYKARFDGRVPPGVGQGAVFEGMVIRAWLRANRHRNDRVRAVLLDEADAASIPAALSEYHWFAAHGNAGYAGLLAWLRDAATTSAVPAVDIAPGFLVAVRWVVAERRASQGVLAQDWTTLRHDDMLAVLDPGLEWPSFRQDARELGEHPHYRLVAGVARRVLRPDASRPPIDCLPSQIRALPKDLHGPAVALLARAQQRLAPMPNTMAILAPLFGVDPVAIASDRQRFPDTITEGMLSYAHLVDPTVGRWRGATTAAERIAKALGIPLP